MGVFRVEYNEEQRGFHHEDINGTHNPNTYGWVTIFESMDNLEFDFFDSFLYRCHDHDDPLTIDYVKKQALEFRQMQKKLNELGIKITR